MSQQIIWVLKRNSLEAQFCGGKDGEKMKRSKIYVWNTQDIVQEEDYHRLSFSIDTFFQERPIQFIFKRYLCTAFPEAPFGICLDQSYCESRLVNSIGQLFVRGYQFQTYMRNKSLFQSLCIPTSVTRNRDIQHLNYFEEKWSINLLNKHKQTQCIV